MPPCAYLTTRCLVCLSHDAVADMGDTIGLDHTCALELEPAIIEVGEQVDAAAEEDGDDVQVDLVQKARLQELLGDGDGADDNVSPAGNGAGLFERALKSGQRGTRSRAAREGARRVP